SRAGRRAPGAASAAPALAALQRRRPAVGVTGDQRVRTRHLRQRGRAAHGPPLRRPQVRPHRGHPGARAARLPERRPAHLPRDRRARGADVLLLRGGHMNRVRLLHVTEFDYDGPVSESYNEVHLQPIDDEYQNCVGFRLRTQPASSPTASRDYFGNWVHRFNVMPKHRRLRVEAESVVMTQQPGVGAGSSETLAAVERQRPALLDEHYDFLVPSTYVPVPDGIAQLLRAAEDAS